jgi:hypothetical protein
MEFWKKWAIIKLCCNLTLTEFTVIFARNKNQPKQINMKKLKKKMNKVKLPTQSILMLAQRGNLKLILVQQQKSHYLKKISAKNKKLKMLKKQKLKIL